MAGPGIIKPLDLVRKAVAAEHDTPAMVKEFVYNEYNISLSPQTIGRLLKRVLSETTTYAVETVQVSVEYSLPAETLCRKIAVLINEHGLKEVEVAVKMAGWYLDR